MVNSRLPVSKKGLVAESSRPMNLDKQMKALVCVTGFCFRVLSIFRFQPRDFSRQSTRNLEPSYENSA